MGVISNIATASRCLLCFYKARPAFPTGPTDLGGGGTTVFSLISSKHRLHRYWLVIMLNYAHMAHDHKAFYTKFGCWDLENS